MKCAECGFQNSQDAMQCTHCGSMMNAGVPIDRKKDEKRTQLGQGVPEGEMIGETIVDRDYFERGISGQDTLECRKCKYIMRTGSVICPNCNERVGQNTRNSGSNSPSSTSHKKTKKLEDFLVEAPLPSMDMVPMHNTNLPKFEDIVNEINISREDVDTNDMSLSSSSHILITYDQKSETWYLENTASNQAVFVQVNGKIPITSDMVVLLGQSKLYQLVIHQNKKSK